MSTSKTFVIRWRDVNYYTDTIEVLESEDEVEVAQRHVAEMSDTERNMAWQDSETSDIEVERDLTGGEE